MTITALIADDEESPRAQLLAALRGAWPELVDVHECANGVDAWDLFLEREPQVCFLDVRMPGMTGIDVAQRIGALARVVFVAAQGDHALAAFDAGAVDYLLKPVDPPGLAATVSRLKARLAEPGAAPVDLHVLLAPLASQMRRAAPLDVIEAGIGSEVRLVPVADVVYFESDLRFTRVVCRDDEVRVRTPLKELIAQLDAGRFWQIHRSVIVNRLQIAGTSLGEDGKLAVTLHGRSGTLPVGHQFRSLFRVH